MRSHSDTPIMDQIKQSAALLAEYKALELELSNDLHGLFGLTLPALGQSTVVNIEAVVVKSPESFLTEEFIDGAWGAVPASRIAANPALAVEGSDTLKNTVTGFDKLLSGNLGKFAPGSTTSSSGAVDDPAGFAHAMGGYVGIHGGADWVPLKNFLAGGMLSQTWPIPPSISSQSGGVTPPPAARAAPANAGQWRWH